MEKENKNTKAPVLSDKGSVDLNQIKKDIQEVAKKERKPRVKKAELEKQIEMVNDFEKLISPESFEAIVKLPSESMYAISGWEGWLLRENEVKALSVNASITAKYWCQIDPKWLALILFLGNGMMIYGSRTIAYYQDKKEKIKVAKEKKINEAKN